MLHLCRTLSPLVHIVKHFDHTSGRAAGRVSHSPLSEPLRSSRVLSLLSPVLSSLINEVLCWSSPARCDDIPVLVCCLSCWSAADHPRPPIGQKEDPPVPFFLRRSWCFPKGPAGGSRVRVRRGSYLIVRPKNGLMALSCQCCQWKAVIWCNFFLIHPNAEASVYEGGEADGVNPKRRLGGCYLSERSEVRR